VIAGGITDPKQLLLRIPAKFQYNSINNPVQLKEDEEEKALQSNTAPVQRMVEEEEEKTQMKQGGKETGTDQPITPVFSRMNHATQEKMEGSFSTGFSDVNIIHNDPSAKYMGALAYTQGEDVHFASGEYNPGSQEGQELPGHELAHVVQQRQGQGKTDQTGKRHVRKR
jgi:hypothetical protein